MTKGIRLLKGIGLLFLSILILIMFVGQVTVCAAEIPELEYKLTSNGATTRYAQPGDTITVQFSVNRTDGIDED